MNNVNVRTRSLRANKAIKRQERVMLFKSLFFLCLAIFGVITILGISDSELNFITNRTFSGFMVDILVVAYTSCCFIKAVSCLEKL